MSDNINELLDPPLVVHKKSDASYQQTAVEVDMNETRVEDDGPTLTRHRFKKIESQKGNKSFVLFLAVFVVAVSICVLFFTGNISFDKEEKTTQKPSTTQSTTTIEQAYEGTIVIKDMYIFVDGVEVDGIEGLQNQLKYEDANTTAYVIVDENANADYLNDEILPVLMQLGFYGDDTEITHKVSTGLIANEETTTIVYTTQQTVTE